MLFPNNTDTIPSATLQLRNLNNRHYLELTVSIKDATTDQKDPAHCASPLSGFNFIILSETENRAFAFSLHSEDALVAAFHDTPHELELLRITGTVGQGDNPIIATKPIPHGPERNIILARFPFLHTIPAAVTQDGPSTGKA